MKSLTRSQVDKLPYNSEYMEVQIITVGHSQGCRTDYIRSRKHFSVNDVNTLLSQLQTAVDKVEEGVNTGDSRSCIQKALRDVDTLLGQLKKIVD